MGATAGKRTVLGTVFWCVSMAVPTAAGAFLIFDKHRSIAEGAPVPATAAAEVAPDGPTPVERVVVAPRYADPELLKQKREQDALLRPRYESAQRQAEAREAMDNAGGAMKPTGNARPSRVGPAPAPPEDAFPPASGAAPASPGHGGAGPGPRIYGLPEEPPAATPPAPRGARRR